MWRDGKTCALDMEICTNGETTMRYEKPIIIANTKAVSAIQGGKGIEAEDSNSVGHTNGAAQPVDE